MKSLRIRGAARDGIQVAAGATNVVIDSVSVSGSTLRNVAVDNASDVSVCCSVLSAAVANNMVVKNGATRVSVHTTVLVGSPAANPTALVNDAGTPDPSTTLDVQNNIVWQWGQGFGTLIYKGATPSCSRRSSSLRSVRSTRRSTPWRFRRRWPSARHSRSPTRRGMSDQARPTLPRRRSTSRSATRSTRVPCT